MYLKCQKGTFVQRKTVSFYLFVREQIGIYSAFFLVLPVANYLAAIFGDGPFSASQARRPASSSILVVILYKYMESSTNPRLLEQKPSSAVHRQLQLWRMSMVACRLRNWSSPNQPCRPDHPIHHSS